MRPTERVPRTEEQSEDSAQDRVRETTGRAETSGPRPPEPVDQARGPGWATIPDPPRV